MSVIPSCDPLEVAKRRIFQACSLVSLLGIVRLVMGLSALITYRRDISEHINALLTLVHACVLLGLGYGLYRKSRVAAILFLVYVIGFQLFTFFAAEPAGSGITAIILTCTSLVFGIRAIPATFRYRARMKERRKDQT